MFRKYFLIRFIFFIIASLVFLLWVQITESDSQVFLKEFHEQDFRGSISSINDTGRGTISVVLDKSEIIDFGYFLNYSNCPLQINDSIAKDSNSLVIKVFRDNELIYTEYNEYYERKLK